jgi:hypothetical protein
MGFELNRIMKQYGVSTPGQVNYSGTSAPSTALDTAYYAKMNPDLAAAKLTTPEQLQQHYTDYGKTEGRAAYDQGAFDEQMRKYNLDQKSYDTYKTNYQNRLQNTPMYAQSQFQTAPQPVAETVTDLYKMYLGRDPEAGIDGSAAASTRPQFIQEAQAELDTMPNFGNQNLMNATGSYYGNQYSAPTYGIAPLSFGTPQNIRNWYKQQTDLGYTDADLRTGAKQNYGSIPDDAWNSLKANAAHGGSVNDLMAKYAQGGAVKTHYQTAGEVRLPSGYGSLTEEEDFASRFFTPSPEVVVSPVNMDTPSEETIITEMPAQAVIDPMKSDLGPGQAPPMSEVTQTAPPNKMQEIEAMLAAYGPSNNTYSAELKLSREKANKETEAFSKMLTEAMGSPEDEKSSKAEMYFRLAAAFGSPTKTGGFGENLALASKEMAEYNKGKRSSAKDKLALALEAQKLRMSAAKDDVTALRALSAEEMKDKRAISSKMIEAYIKSGEPQSAAGKQAKDEGLTPGTSAYQTRVQAIAAASVDAKLAQINAQIAGMSLSQAKLINEQLSTQKMSDAELRLVIDARDTIGTLEGAIGDIKQAIGLNQNAYGGSIADLTEETITQLFVPGDEKLRNTRLLKNFLGAQGVAKLRASFGGNPTEGERKILLELEGIDALTSAERATIMVRTLDALDKKAAREKKKLEELQSGSLRRYTKNQSLARPTTGD